MSRVALKTIAAASLVAAALPVLLAGCSQDDANNADQTASLGKVPSVSSKLLVSPLTGEEITSAQLSGELACTFSDSSKNYILYASGLVGSTEPSQGIVKLDGEIKRVSAPSGFNGMLNGAAFIGHDLDVTVTPIGNASGGGESPQIPAKILIVKDDRISLSTQGQWQCAP